MFQFGILPFVMKKENECQGVIAKRKRHSIKNRKII